MISKQWYVADFETTSYQYYVEHGYTKVWLWAICDSNAEMYARGYDIDSFIQQCKKLVGKNIYFHNLKFDGSFIIDYLMTIGYQYYEDLSKCDTGFTTLIGEMGEFYTIELKYSKNRTVHFVDSLKLLPFSVEKIAKDFGLPILKGKIDYNDYTVTDEVIKYIDHDVRIVAMALKQIKEEGMTKLTTASCAYNSYTGMKSDSFLIGCFPTLDDKFLQQWRLAYRGGRSQVNPLYKGKVLKNVRRFDINSMYPYIMHDMEMPYGDPIKCTKRGQYKFELYHVLISFRLADGHLPSLLKKAALFATEDSYYVESDGVEDIYISSIDYELLERNYVIEYVEFLEIVGFRTTTLMFFDYIDKWYSKKNVDSGAKKIVDKLMLNCLYGKFGSNHRGCHKIPVMDEETRTVKFVNSPEEDMTKYYLPVAIAVTSYAHRLIDDAIYTTGVDKFVYCDTDSVHTLGTLPDRLVDNKKLGKFKLEAIETKSKYVRQKCYITMEDNKLSITCAGMTKAMKEYAIETFGETLFSLFTTGFEMSGKLLPKRVPGGSVLYETTFKIK